MPLGFRQHHPGGMADNSPTFQRWDHENREPSPEGTAEIDSTQPSLRDSSFQTSNPTLKRWAIIVCPFGTDTACALSNPLALDGLSALRVELGVPALAGPSHKNCRASRNLQGRIG